MATFNVPSREEVSVSNQEIFDQLKGKLGFVPNILAAYAHSETALADFLAFQNRKSSLNNKEKEVINLIVSEVNTCNYCKAAHTAIGKMNGFTDEQILEIRSGAASFDPKLDALAKFVKDISVNRSKATPEVVDNFLAAGYTNESIVDTVIIIGEKTITNYLFGAVGFEIDFPAAPELELAKA